MTGVLRGRDVLKVFGPVIGLYSVDVVDVETDRTWPEERFGDEMMDCAGSITNRHGDVRTGRCESTPEDSSGASAPTSDFTSDTARVRCSVNTVEAWNPAPLLSQQITEDGTKTLRVSSEVVTSPATRATRPHSVAARTEFPNPRTVRACGETIHRVLTASRAHVNREQPTRTAALRTDLQLLHGVILAEKVV